MLTPINVKKKPIFLHALSLIILFHTFPAQADITGQAIVIDGDTIEIHGQRIRLFGIDAPESNQLCQIHNKEYLCGKKAAFALNDLINKKTVRCEEKGLDKYKRTKGDCFVGSTNLNEQMVSQGWALAYRQYSHAFVHSEEKAKAAKAGIWVGSFENPWDFRSSTKGIPKSSKCSIKGNINSAGVRIYHLPESAAYNKTKIDSQKGEQWFCSESEALAAGWRIAKER